MLPKTVVKSSFWFGLLVTWPMLLLFAFVLLLLLLLFFSMTRDEGWEVDGGAIFLVSASDVVGMALFCMEILDFA